MATCGHVEEGDLFNCQLCTQRGGRFVYDIEGDARTARCEKSVESSHAQSLGAVAMALGIGVTILIIAALGRPLEP